MSGPYQGQDLFNCGVGRLRVAINCGVLSVKVMWQFIACGLLPPVPITQFGNISQNVSYFRCGHNLIKFILGAIYFFKWAWSGHSFIISLIHI